MQPSRYSCSSSVDNEALLNLEDCATTQECIAVRRQYFGGWEIDNTLTALTIAKFDPFFQTRSVHYASVFWSPTLPVSLVIVPSNDYFSWPNTSVSALSGFEFNDGFIHNTSQDGMFTVTYTIGITKGTGQTEGTAVVWALVFQSTSTSLSCARSTSVLTPSCFSGSCIVPIEKGSTVSIQNLSEVPITVTSASISICAI